MVPVFDPAISAGDARTVAKAAQALRPSGQLTRGIHPRRPQLAANTLKVTVVLKPEDVVALLPEPSGRTDKVALTVAGAGRVLDVTLSAKGVRRARKAIQEAGPEGVAVVLQGKLAQGDVLEEAGLSAQPKGAPAGR